MMSTNEQRAENFRRDIHREDIPGPDYRMVTRFVVGAEWMRASLQNARADIPATEVAVKGFRPGRAPAPLIERKREERAQALAASWVTNDLRTILEQDPELLLLSSPAAPDGVKWEGPAQPLEVSFAYRAWRYPRLDEGAIVGHLKSMAGAAGNLSLADRVYEYLSRLIPAGLEDIILSETVVGEVLGDEERMARLHLRRAIANNLLARTLKVEVDEQDLEQAYGLLAVEHSRSLLEIKEELEPNRDVFIQKVEADKAMAVLEALLAGEG